MIKLLSLESVLQPIGGQDGTPRKPRFYADWQS